MAGIKVKSTYLGLRPSRKATFNVSKMFHNPREWHITGMLSFNPFGGISKSLTFIKNERRLRPPVSYSINSALKLKNLDFIWDFYAFKQLSLTDNMPSSVTLLSINIGQLTVQITYTVHALREKVQLLLTRQVIQSRHTPTTIFSKNCQGTQKVCDVWNWDRITQLTKSSLDIK